MSPTAAAARLALAPLALLAILLLPSVLVTPPRADASLPRLAVMDLKAGEDISPEQARMLTGLLRTSLHATGRFTLINREDMEAIARNHEIELVFCDDDACLLRVGALLGAEKLVAGDIGVVMDAVVVNARLVDIAGEELRNERVATGWSSQSVAALQHTMSQLASELSGETPAGYWQWRAAPAGGRVAALVRGIEGERVLLDLGLDARVRRGTIYEVLRTGGPLRQGHDPQGASGAPTGTGDYLRVEEVAGDRGVARCLSGSAAELAPGTPLRVERVPRRITISPFVRYWVALTRHSEIRQAEDSEATYGVSDFGITGHAVGGAVALHPAAWASIRAVGGYAFAGNGEGVRTGEFGHGGTGGIHGEECSLLGCAIQVPLARAHAMDIWGEAEILGLHWSDEASWWWDMLEARGVRHPSLLASLGVPIQLWPTRRIGLRLTPMLAVTLGGDFTVSSLGVTIEPTVSF